MIKDCKYCGKKFDAKTTWQTFCSDAHRQAYFQKTKKQPAQGSKSQQKPA